MINSDRERLGLAAPECADGARRGGSVSCGSGDSVSIPAAGDFWNEHASVSAAGVGSVMSCQDGGSGAGGCVTGPSNANACTSRAASVTYVLNSESGPAESAALQCLKDACDAAGCRLDVVHFGKLDFGETAVLDQFYNAGGLLLRRCLQAARGLITGSQRAPCRQERCSRLSNLQ